MRKIGVDLDGVVARFNDGYADLLSRMAGNRFPEPPIVFPCWDWPTFYEYTKKEQDAAWVEIERAGSHFWQDLNPYPEAGDFLSHLQSRVRRGDEVYFITSRVGDKCKEQTEYWLLGHGWQQNPTVLISAEKGLAARVLSLDYYIDDKTQNCQEVVYENEDTKCFMLAQPWNREVEGVERINTLKEFTDAIPE